MTNLKAVRVTRPGFDTIPEYREDVRIVGFISREDGAHAIFLDEVGRLCSAPISEFNAVETDQ